MDKAKMKIVYAITARETKSASGAYPSTKKYWNRVGIAFVNHDGSLNVRLEALPVSGELHIRDYVPSSESAPSPPTPGAQRSSARVAA